MSSDGPAFFPLADECREFSTLHTKLAAPESVVQVRLRAHLMPLLETIMIYSILNGQKTNASCTMPDPDENTGVVKCFGFCRRS
jgi:hypothetical protein